MIKVIDVKGLGKSYGSHSVLNGVDFSVNKGEVFVILGKNGAGKSSLFKLLIGMNLPTTGSIEIFGRENNLEKNLSNIGFNINEGTFYEQLTAVENLEIHCGYMGCPTNRIPAQLLEVGLDYKNDEAVKNYSTGMRQRLVLARCLIHDPELLIIDEPLNGLDPKSIRDFRELIQTLGAKGKTIVMSSHILSEVAQVATRIAVLSDGRLVLDETLNELQDRYSTDFENKLILMMEGN